MPDRREVHPHHVLRATLEDAFAADVLRAIEVDPRQVQVTLAGCWLAATDAIDLEDVEALGVDAGTLLAALDPREETPAGWDPGRLSGPARDTLVRALGVTAAMGHRRATSGHLLLALMAGKDPVVLDTFAAHGLRARAVRPLVQQWGRRAT